MSDNKIFSDNKTFWKIFAKLKPETRQNMCDVFRKTAEEARKDGNGEMVKEMEMSVIMAERAITKCNSSKNDEETNSEK